jgi:hypothetical protein
VVIPEVRLKRVTFEVSLTSHLLMPTVLFSVASCNL